MLMTNLNDVLLAMSNIPVDDPIAEIWGRGLQGGRYTVIEYTGALPITINANGESLIDYRIYGNTEQTGTPTPENPIMPIGCGERTANFWDFQPSTKQSGVTLTWNGTKIVFSGICTLSTNFTKSITLSAGTYTIKANANRIPVEDNNSCVDVYKASPYMMAKIPNWNATNGIVNFTLGEETTVSLRIRVQADVNYDGFTLEPMLNSGSTALPYEPYGYKLPMMSRTENLFDISSVIYRTWTSHDGSVSTYSYGARSISMPSNKITVSFNGAVFPYSCSIVWLNSNDEFIIRHHFNIYYQMISPRTFLPPDNAAKFYIQISNGTDATKQITKEQIESYKIMLNLGSTAPPYQPYRRTVTNTYLGEVETTRRIKKLVLTGEEIWGVNASASTEDTIYAYSPVIAPNTFVVDYSICSHFVYKNVYDIRDENGFHLASISNGLRIRIMRTIAETRDDFKSYLAAQYAAGTPVTVWYVLAEPETGIVNEPLMKIGDYADTVSMEQASASIPTNKGGTVIDYDGTTKPSQMYIKYQGVKND